MTDCGKFETLMTEVLSGAADQEGRLRLQNHCAECAACRREFEAQSALMDRIISAKRPDPGKAFWDGFYDRLEERMDQKGRVSRPADPGLATGEHERVERAQSPLGEFFESLRRLLTPIPAWSLQLAAAVLLVSVGIAIGRQSPDENVAELTPGDDLTTEQGPGPAADARQASLEQQALDTISRSRTLLLGLVNFDPASEHPSTLDIPARRTLARRLADEASVLKADLAGADRRRLSELISDLEIILIQIANLEANADVPEIEILQSSVDRGAIMFKIDIEQMRRVNGLGGADTGIGSSSEPSSEPAV